MKKNYFIAFILVLLICNSCQKDEDDRIIEDQLYLVGTWRLTDLSVKKGIISSTILDENFLINYTSEGKDFDYTLKISDDPNSIEGNGSYTSIITTTALGKTDTFEEKVTDFIISGSWKITKHQLIITSQDQITVGDILEFTDDHIIIKQKFEDKVEDSVMGTEAVTSGILTYRLER